VRSAPDRESGFIDAARACGLRAAVLVPFQDGPRRFGVALLFKGFPRHLDDMGATIAKLSTKILPLLAMKRAETALRQEQKLARLLFENLYAPLFMFDPQLRCTTWNPALSQRTGVPEDATLGRPITDIVGRPGDPTLEDAMRAALSGETTLVHDLSFHVADTDEPTSVDAYFAPLHDDDGAISGGVTFLHDVTERKRLEDMLRESQKMEAIGKLASGVAHDFNNILTVVLGNMELLRMRIPEDDSLTRLIVASEQMAGRARIIVQQMLMFAGRQRLEPTAIDVGEVVEALRDMLRQALGDRISLAIQHTANSTAARLDMTQLEIALLNLASNARDAMGNAGALTIAVGDVDAREGEIGPNSRAGRFITIRVADTGAGMSQEVSRQAFDPFFTTKAPGEGSGLGLSQVYGFVRQSGGFVQLASEAGQGTTITLFFPAASAEEVPVAEPRPKVVRGGNERILVVEDEDAVREMALGALEELGYSVLEAANADAGSVILSRDHRSIDLVFCDIAMLGKLQGIELARLALGLQPPIKVLLTSGYGERVRQSSAFPAGARFLAKPYNVRDLATAVRTTLDRNAGQG
jgi:PAS domain S-box-containing protein